MHIKVYIHIHGTYFYHKKAFFSSKLALGPHYPKASGCCSLETYYKAINKINRPNTIKRTVARILVSVEVKKLNLF